MKYKLTFIFTVVITICNAQLDSKTTSYIDSIMNAYYKPNEPGAVILIAEEGNVLFRKAYGMANLELNIPQKAENNFAIASNTKQFTAVCILQLVQQGKINLQDNIKKYLPAYNTHGRHISVENLLTHTSGIVDYPSISTFNKEHIHHTTQEDIIQSFQNDSLQFEPGTEYNYCNSNYFLLGVMIEKVSGLSFEEYLQKNIFDVVGMKNTFVGSHFKLTPNLVNGYQLMDDGKYFPAFYFDWSWPFSAGGIISNVDDLLKWDEALYTNKILDQKWIDLAETSYILKNGDTTGYGYGREIGDFVGMKCVRHGGAIDGFTAEFHRIPSKHIYFVGLTNNSEKHPGMLPELVYRIINNKFELSKQILLNSSQMKEYSGVYTFNENDIKGTGFLKISCKDSSIYITVEYGEEYKLVYAGNDQFYYQENDLWTIQFGRDDKNRICSMTHIYPFYKSQATFVKSKKEYKSNVLMLKEFRSAIELNNIERAVKLFNSYKKDAKAETIFEEHELNQFGYELLNNNKLKEAIVVLKINTEEYPMSWNVFDSLAEAYMLNGEKQLAVKNYEKSLILNPENGNAMMMLKKLKVEK